MEQDSIVLGGEAVVRLYDELMKILVAQNLKPNEVTCHISTGAYGKNLEVIPHDWAENELRYTHREGEHEVVRVSFY